MYQLQNSNVSNIYSAIKNDMKQLQYQRWLFKYYQQLTFLHSLVTEVIFIDSDKFNLFVYNSSSE